MKLCVALDLDNKIDNLKLANTIRDFDVWLKVGLRSFIRDGWGLLYDLKQINPNFKIFLDLKLYDIPNTMANAAEEIAARGLCDMFNVHASSGSVAMKMMMYRLRGLENRPLVLAVTALTSFDNREFRTVYNASIEHKVSELAKMSYFAKLDGVVCSVHESEFIKRETSKSFITLTPGIRPFDEASDDQKRVANIDGAKEALSDFIVVGRPIYKSDDPRGVVEKIVHKI